MMTRDRHSPAPRAERRPGDEDAPCPGPRPSASHPPARGPQPAGLAILPLVLLLGFAATGFGPPALIESSEGSDPFYAHQVPLARRLEAPAVGAPSVAVLDEATGQLLYGKDERRRRPMASTTKIMTALVALERGQLSQVVTVDLDAADMPGSSTMGLSAGEQLTLLDLLYGLLLPSGNDAALAIGRAVAGSDAAFVDLMNQRAAELGLADTHYANPHGLDAPDHYTTALDLARLTRIALRNPTFAQIVATREKTVQGKATYRLRNTNRLLSRPDVEGVKTGTTEAAGQCLVAVVRRDGRRVITVALGSPDHAADSLALADYAFAAYAWPDLRLPDSPFERELLGSHGSPDTVKPPTIVLPAWQVPLLRTQIDSTARSVCFLVAGSPVATVALAR